MSKNNKGFTLIELLVVIAIIGILASVVLASLNTARDKARDAAIKADVSSVRNTAELIFSDATTGGYTTLCSGGQFDESSNSTAIDTALANLDDHLEAMNGLTGTLTYGCNSDASAWAVTVPLKSNSLNRWCADSSGTVRQITSALGTATTCPAS